MGLNGYKKSPKSMGLSSLLRPKGRLFMGKRTNPLRTYSDGRGQALQPYQRIV